MEFKRKLTKMNKKLKEKRMKDKGFKKITIRGRKRWYKPEKAKAEA